MGNATGCGRSSLIYEPPHDLFINSLAHVWGKQTFTDKNTARDNGILAFLPLARVTIIFITSLRMTTVTAYIGGITTQPNG